jgi:hypothetical protein
MNKGNSPPSIFQRLSDAACKKSIPHKHVVIWHLTVVVQWLGDIRLHVLHNAVRVTEEEIFGKIHS